MKDLRVGVAIALVCGLIMLTSCTGKTVAPKADAGSNNPVPAATNSPKVEAETTATKTETTQPTDVKSAATPLAGEYCYGTHDKNLTAEARIKIQDNRITGNLKGTVHNHEMGYFTSYTQTATGDLLNNQAKMQIKTEIENDHQTNQETWTIRDRSLKTQRVNFDRMDCSELEKLLEKTKDAN